MESVMWAINSKYVGKTYFEWSLYLESFDLELKQRSPNQLKHLNCLISLNKEMDWAFKMEQVLELEEV